MFAGPKRSFTVALSLLSLFACGACGGVGESTGSGSEESPSTPTPYAAMGGTTTPSCTPAVALGDPIAAPLPSFTCPAGWQSRERSSALPLSGRFTTPREMVDALCTQSDGIGSTPTSADPFVIGIDFETNDVVAVAYDGEIGLHRRGGELWIRHTESCTGSYRTALFVVPKHAEPREQTCSMPCD